MEQRAVSEALASSTLAVISLGGGAVLSDENRRKLRAAATCIWLTASAETLHQRVEADPASAERRPALLATSDVEAVRKLLAVREPWYRETAERIIDTEHLEPDQIVERIAQAIGGGAHGA
jgi:shikimate kinase